MFGQQRPKPDARMFRHVLARLKLRPEPTACWSRTRWSTRRPRTRLGMRTVWMQRYLDGRFRGTLRDGINSGRADAKVGVHPCHSPPMCMPESIRCRRCAPCDEPLHPTAASDTPAETDAPDGGTGRRVAVGDAPARKRPKPGERRIQILQTLAAHARAARRRAHHHRRAGRQARRQRSRAVPPLRQQGADVRGPDRVHREQRVHAGQPDRRARDRRRRAGAQGAHRAAAVRREEPRHDARDGRRRAGVRERPPARAHEPVLRPHRVAAAPEPARARPRRPARRRRRSTPTRRPRC